MARVKAPKAEKPLWMKAHPKLVPIVQVAIRDVFVEENRILTLAELTEKLVAKKVWLHDWAFRDVMKEYVAEQYATEIKEDTWEWVSNTWGR